MSKQIYIDSQGNENLISGTINTGETLPLTTNPSDGTVSEAIGDLETNKQNKITYHQETTTPDAGGAFNTGVTTDKLPLCCTSSNGYVSGFVYSGGYWYARIVNYSGTPITTAVTVSTWYVDNPS